MPLNPKIKKILITGALGLLVASSVVGIFSYTHDSSYNPSILVTARRRINHTEREINQDKNAINAAKHNKAFTIGGHTFHHEDSIYDNNTGVGNNTNWKEDLKELERIGSQYGFNKPTSGDYKAARSSRNYLRTLFHAYQNGLYDHVANSYANHQINDISNESNIRHNKPIDFNGHKIINENQDTYHGSISNLIKLAAKDGYHIGPSKYKQYLKWFKQKHPKEGEYAFLKHCIEDGTYEHAKGAIKRGHEAAREGREQGRVISRCHRNRNCVLRRDKRLHIGPYSPLRRHIHSGSSTHGPGTPRNHNNNGSKSNIACQTVKPAGAYKRLPEISNVSGNQLIVNTKLSKAVMDKKQPTASMSNGNMVKNNTTKAINNSAQGTLSSTWKQICTDILKAGKPAVDPDPKSVPPKEYQNPPSQHYKEVDYKVPNGTDSHGNTIYKQEKSYYPLYRIKTEDKDDKTVADTVNDNYFTTGGLNKEYPDVEQTAKSAYKSIVGSNTQPMKNNNGTHRVGGGGPNVSFDITNTGFGTVPETLQTQIMTYASQQGGNAAVPTYGGPDSPQVISTETAHSYDFGDDHNSAGYGYLQKGAGPNNSDRSDFVANLPDNEQNPNTTIKVTFPDQAKYIPNQEKYDVSNKSRDLMKHLGVSLTPVMTISNIKYYHPWYGIDYGPYTQRNIDISKNFSRGMRVNGITSMKVNYTFKYTPTSDEKSEMSKVGINPDSFSDSLKGITNGSNIKPVNSNVEKQDGQAEQQANSNNWYLSIDHLDGITNYQMAGENCPPGGGMLDNSSSNEKYVQSLWNGSALSNNGDVSKDAHANPGQSYSHPYYVYNPDDIKSTTKTEHGQTISGALDPKKTYVKSQNSLFWSDMSGTNQEWMFDPEKVNAGWRDKARTTATPYNQNDHTGTFAQSPGGDVTKNEYAGAKNSDTVIYPSSIYGGNVVGGSYGNTADDVHKIEGVFRFKPGTSTQDPNLNIVFGSGVGYGVLIPSSEDIPNKNAAPLNCIYNRVNEKPYFSVGSGNFENGGNDISGVAVSHKYLTSNSASSLENGGTDPVTGNKVPGMSKTDAEAIANGGLKSWVDKNKCTIPCNQGHCPTPKVPTIKKSVGAVHHATIKDNQGHGQKGGQLEYPNQVYTYYLTGTIPKYPKDDDDYTQHGYTAKWGYNGHSWTKKPTNNKDFYRVVDNLPKEVTVKNAKLVSHPLEDKDDTGTYDQPQGAKISTSPQHVKMEFDRNNSYGGSLVDDSGKTYCLAITVQANHLPTPHTKGWYKYWNGTDYNGSGSDNGAYADTNYGTDNAWRENPIDSNNNQYEPIHGTKGNHTANIPRNGQGGNPNPQEGTPTGKPARQNFTPVPMEIKKLSATIYHYDYNHNENLHNNHFPDNEQPFGFDSTVCSDPGNTHEGENTNTYPNPSKPDDNYNNGRNYSDSLNYKNYRYHRYFVNDKNKGLLHTSHVVGYVGSNFGVRFLDGRKYYKNNHKQWAFRAVYPGLPVQGNTSVNPNFTTSNDNDKQLLLHNPLANEANFKPDEDKLSSDWKGGDLNYWADTYKGNNGVPVRMNPDCGDAYTGNPDKGNNNDFTQVNYFPYIVPRINMPASHKRGGDNNEVPTPHTHHNPNYNPDNKGDNSNSSQIGKHPINERLIIDTDKKGHGLPFRMDMRVQNFIQERHYFRDFLGDNVTMTIKSNGHQLYKETRPLVQPANGNQEQNKRAQTHADLAHLRDTYEPGTGWTAHDITNDEWPKGDLSWQGYIQRNAFKAAEANNDKYNLKTENTPIESNHHIPVDVTFNVTSNKGPTERVDTPSMHSEAYVASRNRIKNNTFKNNRAHFIRPERTIEYFNSRPYDPRVLYEEIGVNQPRNAYAKTGYGMTGNDFGVYYMGHLQAHQYAHKGSSVDYAFPPQFQSADNDISYSKDPRNHKFGRKKMLVDGLLHVKPRLTPTDPSVSDADAGKIEYENKNNAEYHNDNGENYGLPDYLDSEYNNPAEINADYYFDKCFPEGIITGIYSSIYGFYPRMSYHNTEGIDRVPEGEVAIAKNNEWKRGRHSKESYATHQGFGDKPDNGSGYSFNVTGNKQEQTNTKKIYHNDAENITDNGQDERMFTPKFMRLGLYKVIFEKAYDRSGQGTRAHRMGGNFFDIDEDRRVHFYAHQYIAKNSRSKDQDELSLQPILTDPHGLNQISTSSPLFPSDWLSSADNDNKIGHSWKSLAQNTGL